MACYLLQPKDAMCDVSQPIRKCKRVTDKVNFFVSHWWDKIK